MLANAAMHQALINRGLTRWLDCDTVEPKPKVKALGRLGEKPLRLTRVEYVLQFNLTSKYARWMPRATVLG